VYQDARCKNHKIWQTLKVSWGTTCTAILGVQSWIRLFPHNMQQDCRPCETAWNIDRYINHNILKYNCLEDWWKNEVTWNGSWNVARWIGSKS
jgi:hypothetical protein